MQFYLNGYNPGDPDIQAAAPGAEARPAALPNTTDVLIVGAGPAGMLLAAQSPASRHASSIVARVLCRSVKRTGSPAARRDVRRLRPERETHPRSILGERDGLLASVSRRSIEDRPDWARARYR
jgi:hypothetical protein